MKALCIVLLFLLLAAAVPPPARAQDPARIAEGILLLLYLVGWGAQALKSSAKTPEPPPPVPPAPRPADECGPDVTAPAQEQIFLP